MRTHGYLQLTETYPLGHSNPPNPKEPEMLKAYSRIQARINSLRTEDGATATE